jgi:hypothetical protein
MRRDAVLQSIAVKYDALAAEQIGNRLDAFVIVNFHDAHPVWIASLLRSDMIFRRDRCALRWREAVQILIDHPLRSENAAP